MAFTTGSSNMCSTHLLNRGVLAKQLKHYKRYAELLVSQASYSLEKYTRGKVTFTWSLLVKKVVVVLSCVHKVYWREALFNPVGTSTQSPTFTNLSHSSLFAYLFDLTSMTQHINPPAVRYNGFIFCVRFYYTFIIYFIYVLIKKTKTYCFSLIISALSNHGQIK